MKKILILLIMLMSVVGFVVADTKISADDMRYGSGDSRAEGTTTNFIDWLVSLFTEGRAGPTVYCGWEYNGNKGCDAATYSCDGNYDSWYDVTEYSTESACLSAMGSGGSSATCPVSYECTSDYGRYLKTNSDCSTQLKHCPGSEVCDKGNTGSSSSSICYDDDAWYDYDCSSNGYVISSNHPNFSPFTCENGCYDDYIGINGLQSISELKTRICAEESFDYFIYTCSYGEISGDFKNSYQTKTSCDSNNCDVSYWRTVTHQTISSAEDGMCTEYTNPTPPVTPPVTPSGDDCSDYKYYDTCIAFGCFWYSTLTTATYKCEDPGEQYSNTQCNNLGNDQGRCNHMDGCEWANDGCRKDQSDCSSLNWYTCVFGDNDCEWGFGGPCKDKEPTPGPPPTPSECSDYQYYDFCINENCFWDSTSKTATYKCEAPGSQYSNTQCNNLGSDSSQVCNHMDGCEWENEKCEAVTTCSDYQYYDTCIASDCYWDSSFTTDTYKCEIPGKKYNDVRCNGLGVDQGFCSQMPGCMWVNDICQEDKVCISYIAADCPTYRCDINYWNLPAKCVEQGEQEEEEEEEQEEEEQEEEEQEEEEQEEEEQEEEEEGIVNLYSGIYINSLKIDQSKVKPGEEITGTITIRNTRDNKVTVMPEVWVKPYSRAGTETLEANGCCGNYNYASSTVVLQASSTQSYDFSIAAPYEGLVDNCGGAESFWGGDNTNYVVKGQIYTDCYNANNPDPDWQLIGVEKATFIVVESELEIECVVNNDCSAETNWPFMQCSSFGQCIPYPHCKVDGVCDNKKGETADCEDCADPCGDEDGNCYDDCTGDKITGCTSSVTGCDKLPEILVCGEIDETQTTYRNHCERSEAGASFVSVGRCPFIMETWMWIAIGFGGLLLLFFLFKDD